MKASPSPFAFISYARTDGFVVQQLRTDLAVQGINTWIDIESLPSGTPDWEEATRLAIREAHAVLFMASPAAQKSRIVKDELRMVLDPCGGKW